MRVNPGVVAIVLAYVVVAIFAPLYRQPLGEKALAAGFPAELFLTLLGVSLLFMQAEANGTLACVSHAADRLTAGFRCTLPIVFFVLALAIGTLGPGNIAIAGLVARMAMAADQRAGISPLVMALLVGHGRWAAACTFAVGEELTPSGVVLPAFLPMVKDIATAQPGSNPLNLALAVLVGGNLVDMSPLSTIGALCLAAPPECDRRKLFHQLFAWGFAMAFVGAVISWVCF
jgi:hypothetical protein